MGARKPENIPLREFRAEHETVGQIARAGWAVISCCSKCRVQLTVDLKLIIRVSGPNASLWNRAKRCKVVGCDGVTVLHAKPPFHSFFTPLMAEWPEGVPPRTARAGS